MTDLDLLVAMERIVRRIVREEIANANRSGGPLSTGIGAPGHGDTECDDALIRAFAEMRSSLGGSP